MSHLSKGEQGLVSTEEGFMPYKFQDQGLRPKKTHNYSQFRYSTLPLFDTQIFPNMYLNSLLEKERQQKPLATRQSSYRWEIRQVKKLQKKSTLRANQMK